MVLAEKGRLLNSVITETLALVPQMGDWLSIRTKISEAATRIHDSPLAQDKESGLTGLIDFSRSVWGALSKE